MLIIERKLTMNITKLFLIIFSLIFMTFNMANALDSKPSITLDIAKKMVDNFGDEISVDMDIMISGAILIDVGKLLEYEIIDGKLTTSDYGKVVRHPFFCQFMKIF